MAPRYRAGVGGNHRGTTLPVAGPWARTAVIAATLADLVARAGDGDALAIPPGLPTGTGPVEITKNLHLFSAEGAELADRIVVRAGAALKLSGLRRTGSTVAVEGAQFDARDCLFESPPGGVAVSIAGEARFTAADCRFAGRVANAVRVRGRATARLSGCRFQSFERAAISVEDIGSTVELAGCRFTGLTSHALAVERGAHARIAECAFDGIGGAGWTAAVAVTSGAGADITNSRWSSLRADGLLGRGGARLRAVDCEFDHVESGWAAVTVDDDATLAELSGCRFTVIDGRVVTADNGATACLADSTVHHTGAQPALAADGPGSTVAMVRSRIVTTEALAAAAGDEAQIILADSVLDTPLGGGQLHTNIDLGRDGSRLRVTGECGFRGAAATATAAVADRDIGPGATVKVIAALAEPCPQCNGTGAPPGTVLRACDGCDAGAAESPPCPRCRGARFLGEGHCAGCDGRGQRNTLRTIEVEIPDGAAQGDTLVAPGRGAPGLGTGPAGDLRVILECPQTGRYRSVEEFVEKKLGIGIAGETTNPAPRSPLDPAARRALDDAVRREAIRLGYLTADEDRSP